MTNSVSATLSRQAGLLRELGVVANNIANMSTDGFRAEKLSFAEIVAQTGQPGDSLSLTRAHAFRPDLGQGALTQTGGEFDMAIEGQGFFTVQLDDGTGLTRQGAFSLNEAGELVTPDGRAVLDTGGAPIAVPQGLGRIAVAADGTLSAGGQPLAQLGVVIPVDLTSLRRAGDTIFTAGSETVPAENAKILQGFQEGSNVDAVAQVTRMIEVQRAYELGQTLLDREDQRLRDAVRTLGQ